MYITSIVPQFHKGFLYVFENRKEMNMDWSVHYIFCFPWSDQMGWAVNITESSHEESKIE